MPVGASANRASKRSLGRAGCGDGEASGAASLRGPEYESAGFLSAPIECHLGKDIPTGQSQSDALFNHFVAVFDRPLATLAAASGGGLCRGRWSGPGALIRRVRERMPEFG